MVFCFLVRSYFPPRAPSFAYAAFCLEEALLAQPHNYALHVALAETLYTHGRADAARRYWAQAVQLHATSARALWGLHLALTRAKPGCGYQSLWVYMWVLTALYTQPTRSCGRPPRRRCASCTRRRRARRLRSHTSPRRRDRPAR
jgi:hypothetical protein